MTGFGGGVIYYPTSTSEGTFGAIAISPGFTAYIDNDTRYEQFLCPPPRVTGDISDYRNTCPHS